MDEDVTTRLKRIKVERKYEVTGAADLQDPQSSRRMVIRPREVRVHQVYGTTLVRDAWVEGQQVRNDGELAGARVIGFGYTRWVAPPPAWLDTLIRGEGLTWQSEEDEAPRG